MLSLHCGGLFLYFFTVYCISEFATAADNNFSFPLLYFLAAVTTSDQIAKCGRGTQFILGNGSTEYDFATAQYLCQRRGANLPMRFDVANSAEVSCYIDYMQKVAGTQRATLDVWSGKCAGRCYFTTNRAEKHRNGYQAALSDVRVLTSFRLVMCERGKQISKGIPELANISPTRVL